MNFTPPPGTPMPPTPQSDSFAIPPPNVLQASGSGAGGAVNGGLANGGGNVVQPPQLVLPNPALAQTNPEMKKKTELKDTNANFSPVRPFLYMFSFSFVFSLVFMD